jgi:hypothetical protein
MAMPSLEIGVSVDSMITGTGILRYGDIPALDPGDKIS